LLLFLPSFLTRLLRNDDDGDAPSPLLLLLGDVVVVKGSLEERFNILFLTNVAYGGSATSSINDDDTATAVAATKPRQLWQAGRDDTAAGFLIWVLFNL
jgi:hypothetical protein